MLWGIPNILSLQQHSGKRIRFSVCEEKKTNKKTWPCANKCGKSFPPTCCSFHFWSIRHLNLTCVDTWLTISASYKKQNLENVAGFSFFKDQGQIFVTFGSCKKLSFKGFMKWNYSHDYYFTSSHWNLGKRSSAAVLHDWDIRTWRV